jgi:hypothetical protein
MIVAAERASDTLAVAKIEDVSAGDRSAAQLAKSIEPRMRATRE